MTPVTSVADLFEKGAAVDPDGLAVVGGPSSLTYAQLEGEANRVARHLQSLGVRPGSLVGVCLPRSVDLAVALVAVLKAGGACVPLEPSYPPERLAQMVEDAAPAVVLTTSALASLVPAAAHQVRLDADGATWRDESPTPPPRAVAADDVAYVIYTSGSTGRPHGVLLTHRGLVNHHLAALDLYRLRPGDRVLQFCSIGFDASIEELFPAWAAGATVVFRPDDMPLLGRDWLAWLRRNRITVLNLPTAYWHAWTNDLDSCGGAVPDDVRLVVVGGEKAQGGAYRTWRRLAGGRSRWINVYGPTETTCMSTFYEPGQADGPGDDGDPPIGRPLPNTVLGVVDNRLRPVAPGTVGELVIGGMGLARGYLNQPARTAERFVADGESGSVGARVYRTGDLVRELPGGNLAFIGRIDDQVKVRGFRVESAEVEGALARHPGVAQAAVVGRSDGVGATALVAYVVVTGIAAPAPGDLRRFLADRLPGYLVPAAFVTVDALPLTVNGKLDRAALRARDLDGDGDGDDAAATATARGPARSAVEEAMAGIWARVLGRKPAEVGVHDDFFDLGGHSLLAAQVIAQVREEFGTQTPLRALFEAPTVAGLSALVEAERPPAPAFDVSLAPRPREPGTRVPLTLAQEQMWGLVSTADPPGLYNLTALAWLERFDEEALRRALAYLTDRHEVLRTGFSVDGGEPHQWAVPAGAAAIDLTVGTVADEAELHRRIAAQDAEPFDAGRPPLVRAGVLRLGSSAQLAVTFDHLVCDGTSATLFMDELDEAYAAARAGTEPALPALDLQFADFARWQRSHVTEEDLDRQLHWWAAALEGMPLGPAVPFDRTPSTPTRRIASVAFTVPAATRHLLEEVASATRSTVFIVAVAAAQVVLAARRGATDVVVSTTLSGRTRAELEGMIGMFSGIGRIRTDVSGDPSLTEVVARVREHVLGMFENQDIPFMRVRQAVVPDFPTGPLALAAALPVELQYFRTRRDHPDAELFFRGQLHPLSITLLDDGTEITAEISYKLDFYDAETIERLARDLAHAFHGAGADPSARLSALTAATVTAGPEPRRPSPASPRQPARPPSEPRTPR